MLRFIEKGCFLPGNDSHPMARPFHAMPSNSLGTTEGGTRCESDAATCNLSSVFTHESIANQNINFGEGLMEYGNQWACGRLCWSVGNYCSWECRVICNGGLLYLLSRRIREL
ncbi:hypothetical protein TNIN_24121 [Trichonephila inaurata madagascariensis]|uniref:Uncharacterized protein n=1 Tax=Trichonephila inaurata madagascariensis TaxID=2747483 RepID=A0A8X6YBQ9_9ARAC|nr:hypothetical protein TNIN_24121 [Trichonephila inaurata madagascariensis]